LTSRRNEWLITSRWGEKAPEADAEYMHITIIASWNEPGSFLTFDVGNVMGK
jgi:hypothetical protein